MKVDARVLRVQHIPEDPEDDSVPVHMTFIEVQTVDEDGQDTEEPGEINFSVKGRLSPDQIKPGDIIVMEMTDPDRDPKLLN